MSVLTLFIIILIIVLILILITVFSIKYLLIAPDWPYIFYLTNENSENQNVTVWVNGINYKPYLLPPGKKGQVIVGENIENPDTKKPYQREEILTVAFQFETKGKVKYYSPNVKNDLIFSAGVCKEKSCGDTIPFDQKNKFNTIGSKGFYTIFF